MLRVLDGKVYNTETAKELAHASSNNPAGDFAYWAESLYLTRSGRYFVAGHGGPMTRYAKPYGQNGWEGSCDLFPLTREQALSWCEKNRIDPVKVKAMFPDLLEEA